MLLCIHSVQRYINLSIITPIVELYLLNWLICTVLEILDWNLFTCFMSAFLYLLEKKNQNILKAKWLINIECKKNFLIQLKSEKMKTRMRVSQIKCCISNWNGWQMGQPFRKEFIPPNLCAVLPININIFWPPYCPRI